MTNSSTATAGTNAVATEYNNLRLDVFDAQRDMNFNSLINSNFDIWQRGTSLALSSATSQYLADRWFDNHDPNAGTLPTLTRSRQLHTSGDVFNSFYFSRLATNGAGTSLGTSSLGYMSQRIEHGTRLLAGASKKVTISFYAKSSIAAKKLGVYIDQNYGTGGSPSTAEVVNGTNFTLTSSWARYTATITLNTLVAKTFGTNNNDYLGINLVYMWGTTLQARVGASAAQTYVGSGNIEISQVLVSTDDATLIYKPRNFETELRMCERYYSKSFTYDTAPAQATGDYTGSVLQYNFSNTTTGTTVRFPARMRTTPTFTTYSPFASDANWYDQDNGSSRAVTTGSLNEFGVWVYGSSFDGSGNRRNAIHWAADAEL